MLWFAATVSNPPESASAGSNWPSSEAIDSSIASKSSMV